MKRKLLILLILVLIGSSSFYIIYKEKNKRESNGVTTTTTNIVKKFEINYKEEKYELKNIDQEVVISNKRNLPIITYYDKNIVSKITNYLNDISDLEWINIKKQSDELLNAGFNENVVGINYLFDIKVLTNDYLSVELSETGNLGGTSWDNIKYYNFSIKNGNILKFNDITKDNESLRNYSFDYVVNYIKNQDYSEFLYNDEINGNWEKILNKNMFNVGNYNIDDKGLNFYLDKYLLGNGIINNIIISIPYDNIKSYINDYKLN